MQGSSVKTRAEYVVLASSLPEPERDQAESVWVQRITLAGDAAALSAIERLKVARGEADGAPSLFLTEAARKSGDDAEITEAIRQLNDATRLGVAFEGFDQAGNRYVLTNDRRSTHLS